jgi:hypothetical protein
MRENLFSFAQKFLNENSENFYENATSVIFTANFTFLSTFGVKIFVK